MKLLNSWRGLVAAVATVGMTATMAALVPAGSAEAAATTPDHLVVAAVYGGSGGTGTYDWIELYNPTSDPISLGTISGKTVTANYHLCYRGVAAAACSTPMALWGTDKAHHYFFVATSGTAGAASTNPTPDLDLTATTKNAAGKTGPNMGGSTTGGQVLLLNAASNGVATFTGDLSSAAAHDAGVVDAVGWTHYQAAADATYAAGYTQPTSAEVNGSTVITGTQGGTANTNVIARTFTNGIPVDSDVNRADFTAVSSTTFVQHSQVGDYVAVAPVADAEISRDEPMSPIQVQGSKGTGALSYAATGLPDGVTIDAVTGVIKGTPAATDELKGYVVTVTVSDSTPGTPDSVATSFTLTVSNVLRIDSLPDVTVRKGAALTPIQVGVHGGTPDYHFAATGLPAGVGIDPDSGAITGTPTDAAGRYTAHVTATDSGAGAAAQTVSTDFALLERPAASNPEQPTDLSALTINEIRATGTPADDWVEIANTGAALTAAALTLADDKGDTFHVPAQDIPAGSYVVVEGADLHAAGVDLPANGTLTLTTTDDTTLDEVTWGTLPPTSWARYPDGTGDFGVSRQATKGAVNSLAAAYATDHLVVAAVYGADGTIFNSDWVELYNPTEEPISLGTIDANGVVTPNYYQCYRSNSSNSCSSMKLYGTVQPHHYFLIWNGHNAETGTVVAHGAGLPPAGITPDLDFRYGTNDTNSAATKAANDPSGQANNGFGGCNTGGQVWLLNAASGGVAPGGDMASASARAAGVVDGVGWTASGTTQPTGAESTGSASVTGLNSGTNNACVITRKFAHGFAVDADANSTDFTAVQDPSTVTVRSQTSDRVAISAIDDTEISLNAPMDPIRVKATAIWGDLAYSATGLPDGITINPSTGVISGTPTATDELTTYTVVVSVADGFAGDTATTSFKLTLSKVLRLDPIAGTTVRQGQPFTAITAISHGGYPAYTYAATGLPAGVTIGASSGTIAGTTTGDIGRYDVEVTVTDSGVGSERASVSTRFSITVLPSVAGPAAGDPLAGLRINEVSASGGPSTDFVELVNTGGALSGTSVVLENALGDTYRVPARDIAAGGFVLIDSAALAAAGLKLGTSGTLYLTETDGTLLDQTSWTASATTSWERYPDGTGDFIVSGWATPGKPNVGAPQIKANDLLVSEVNYDNNGTDWFEYSELTNTTDHAIDFTAYGLSLSKSGAVMSFHDPFDTSAASPVIDPVIPAHATRVLWWVENQYLGVKTTSQFRSNYGLSSSTPVVLVFGASSLANSGGDRTFDITVKKDTGTLISRAYVDTPCAANTLNGTAVCPATNKNYAEHFAVPADRSGADAAVWYNSLYAGGDSVGHPLKPALSNPGTVDLEQVGFTRKIKITSATGTAVTLTNTATGPVDLSGYVLENQAGTDYVLAAGTTVAAGADIVIPATDTGFVLAGEDWVTLLAPRGFAYSDGAGIVDTTGPLLTAVAYDSSTGGDPVIDETTGLPLPPAGGLYRPAGISAVGGRLYISNTGDNVLASIIEGVTANVAGSLIGYGELGNEGPAVDAQLYQPGGTAIDAAGNLYIADSGDDVIRKITTDGVIYRFAGTGVAGGAGAAVTATSTALSVNLWHPNGVAVDAHGNVFIADSFDHRVLKVTPSGSISVIAGTGKAGYAGDGKIGTSARLSLPSGLAVDAQDNVYIADSSNNVIRRVDAATGVITTVAGDYAANQATNSCLGGFSGDGGPATSARLNAPQGIALDGAGDLFIADTYNHAVRKVLADGTISTLVNSSATAGTEGLSPLGGGAFPWTTHLNTPFAVAVDSSTGVLYVADTKNNAVAQVARAAFAGTVAGPVEPAEQIAITGSGTAAQACAALANGPVVSITAPTVVGALEAGSTLTADAGTWTPSPDGLSYQWLRDGVAIAGATGSTYVTAGTDGGHVISVAVTATKEDFASASATSAGVTLQTPADKTFTAGVPTISGTLQVGSTLSANAGTWTPTPDGFGYQWKRDGIAIDGATRSTYTVTSTDGGHVLTVVVTGTKSGYTSASATSAGVAIQTPDTGEHATLTPGVPSISGRFVVGTRLTAAPGTWKAGSVAVTAFGYQWLRNGVAIKGATSAAYTLTAVDYRTRVSVRVTGTAAGYVAASALSAAQVVAPGTLTRATPRISGKAKVGRRLSASAGVWRAGSVRLSGSQLRYQWFAGGKRIAGATKATYKVAKKYRHKRITVRVTGSAPGYASVTVSSKATSAVKAK